MRPVSTARRATRTRAGRAGALLAIVAVLLGTWSVVAGLRRDALAATAAVNHLLDVRQRVTESRAIAWQTLAAGIANIGLSRAEAAVIAADLRALRAEHMPVADMALDVARFEAKLAVEQRLVESRDFTEAGAAALNGADAAGREARNHIEALGRTLTARAARANSHVYSGSLIASSVSALLVAALLFASVRGRRRARAAERAALERSERRFRALVHKASDAVVVVDAAGCVSDATGAVETMFGRPAEDLLGRPVEMLAPVSERARARQLLERVRRDGPLASVSEWAVTDRSGQERHFEVSTADFSADPDVGGVVLTVRDATARHEIEAQLRHQSLHDALTGLPNRTLFENRVSQALSRVGRDGSSVAVLLLDLDGFKSVNDSLGHSAGDELLQLVAGRIDSALRGGDTAARLGGDEFACLLEGLDDTDEALTVARRLSAVLAAHLSVAGRNLAARASIGVAFVDGPLTDAGSLVRNADLAMHAAKEEGRGGFAIFHADMLLDVRRRLDLREDLDVATERGELVLAYQPLVELADRTLSGIEALLRWHHGEHGAIGPDRFIPLAESTGQIVALGRWVLEHALADLALLSRTVPDLRININVAPRELVEADYVDAVRAALARHGIEAHRVTLEITESEFVDDGEVIERLNDLATLGVKLAIDDFGIGQSSLARLQRLPVGQVKLDRSFLSGVDQRPQQATLVRSMIELGHALGLQMVAEGIERESQLDVLSELPCQLGQGYLFGRPQSRAGIMQLLEGPVAAGPSLS